MTDAFRGKNAFARPHRGEVLTHIRSALLPEIAGYGSLADPGSLLIEDVDKASGARFSRDGLDAMMAEIKKGRIDVSA